MVKIKRAYEPAEPEDGERLLVERLWPRGVSKEEARLAGWMRDLAPSTELRRWYAHEPGRWPEFRRRYEEELQAPEKQALIEDLANRALRGTVTLVLAAQDVQHSSARVLADLLERRLHTPGA